MASHFPSAAPLTVNPGVVESLTHDASVLRPSEARDVQTVVSLLGGGGGSGRNQSLGGSLVSMMWTWVVVCSGADMPFVFYRKTLICSVCEWVTVWRSECVCAVDQPLFRAVLFLHAYIAQCKSMWVACLCSFQLFGWLLSVVALGAFHLSFFLLSVIFCTVCPRDWYFWVIEQKKD